MGFASSSGIRLLSWFFLHPSKKVHFRELCRELDFSPLTVKTYCDEFVSKGWLNEERLANLRLFRLNNEDYVVKAMKRAFFISRLKEAKAEQLVEEGIISFALYGSHASGEYDEKSDVDLLIVGRREQFKHERVKQLEKKLGKEIQATIFSLEQWESAKKESFGGSVLHSHVLLSGVPL